MEIVDSSLMDSRKAIFSIAEENENSKDDEEEDDDEEEGEDDDDDDENNKKLLKNVYEFVKQSSPSFDNSTKIVPTLVRSNSFTLQDISRQRRCIQNSMYQSALRLPPSTNTLDCGYKLHRKMSKSLPELADLRHLPAFSNRNDFFPDTDDEEESDDENLSYIVQDIPVRRTWSSRTDFILTLVGFSLGLNNVWRFPYLCYANDGAPFIIAYYVLMLAIGLPLLCLEYSVGQLTLRGAMVFGDLCPLLKGVVLTASMATAALLPVYSSVNSWSLFYFFKSLFPVPPWSKCGNIWNTKTCISRDTNNSLDLISTLFVYGTIKETNSTTTITTTTTKFNISNLANLVNQTANTSIFYDGRFYASQEFFDNKLFDMETKTNSLGVINWELAIFVTVIWISIFISLRKDILFSSHPSYFLAIIPFLLITIFFLRMLTLNGANTGLIYLFSPTMDGILKHEVWLDAAAFCIHSLGCVLGTSVAVARCNKTKNNFLRDAIIVCLLNMLIVAMLGSIIFGTLGYLSEQRGVEISQLLPKEPGVSFIVFSELLSSMPLTTLWSSLFFLLIFLIGTDYQIFIMATLMATLEEICLPRIKNFFCLMLLMCFLFFLISLIFITEKGIIAVIAVEEYITIWLSLFLAFFEVILIGWFYGGNKYTKALTAKTTKKIGCYLTTSWIVFLPIVLLTILIFNIISFKEITYSNYNNLDVFNLIGKLFVLVGLLILPITAIIEIRKTPKTTLITRVLTACMPRNKLMEMKESNLLTANENSFHKFNKIIINSQCPNIVFQKPSILVLPPITLSLIQGLNRETIL